MASIDYIVPALSQEGWLPLARYLDPVPPNIVRRYLEAHSDAGDMVVDPFCQTGGLAEEAEALGRRPVLAHFSPINTLLARTTLGGIDPDDLDAAIVRVSDTPKRGQPLREHLRDLYRSRCQRCGSPVELDSLSWERGRAMEKDYACPTCGHHGPAASDEGDRETAQALDPRGPHYWYVVERLAPADERERDQVQSLLELYPTRSLYALVTLSIKAEAVLAASPVRDHVNLALLLCLERCSKIADARRPGPWARPRVPQSWTERNVWSAFEEAVAEVKGNLKPAPAAGLEDVVRGLAVRPLLHQIGRGQADMILTVPPSPMRSYWSLSYLWSGWLFGPDAAAAFRPLLGPRSLDWRWYVRAMGTAFRILSQLLKPQAPMVILSEHALPEQWLGLCLAAASAELEWSSILLQPRSRLEGDGPRWRARIQLHRSTPQAIVAGGSDLEGPMRRAVAESGRRLLEIHGEALPTDRLKAAALEEWAVRGLLRRAALEKRTDPDTLRRFLEDGLAEALEKGELGGIPAPVGVPPGGNGEPAPLPTHWWVPDRSPDGALLDEVEETVHALLTKGTDLEAILSNFPGLRVPDEGILEAALRSYGEERDGTWIARGDDEGLSASALREVRRRLGSIGRLMGYQVGSEDGQSPGDGNRSGSGPGSLPGYAEVWWGDAEEVRYVFVVRSTARLAELYRWTQSPVEGAVHLIAIPDVRAELMAAKLEAAPILRHRMAEARWDSVKWSHLNMLARQDALDRHEFAAFIGLTPLVEEPEAQLPLFR